MVHLKRALKRLLGRDEGILTYASDLMNLDPADERMADWLMGNPVVAAKYYPYQKGRSSYIVQKSSRRPDSRDGALPAPPPDLWLCFEGTLEKFLSSGKSDFENMSRITKDSGFSLHDAKRILDFGCGSGRMTRWLDVDPDVCEVWGVDISAEHIIWCQQHLSPPFNFVTTTTLPHLPFEDGFFSFIYAGSVFSHISDLADAWLLELRRVLSPGGRLYITVHDTHSIDLIRQFPPDHRLYWFTRLLNAFEQQSQFASSNFGMFTITRTPGGAQVFYDHEYLRQHWGRQFKVLSITPKAYLELQSAVVLEKP